MHSKSSVLAAAPETQAIGRSAKPALLRDEDVAGDYTAVLSEESFRRVLCQERRRSERSRKSFLLMLIQGRSHVAHQSVSCSAVLELVPKVLGANLRETDTMGWFESKCSVGVIFSELGDAQTNGAVKSIQAKTIAALAEGFGANQANALDVSFYAFPNETGEDKKRRALDCAIYSDWPELVRRKKTFLVIKRVLDALGSSCALLLLSPVFLVLALLIKLTSSGPVFYRQERLGQFELPFIFLKFRSMRVETDPAIHREYVKNFIAGKAEPNSSSRSHRGVYKITNDPRVTSIGRFMRRTSLDELPQFWNVLMGQMSLVGPRPPIRYELDAYDLWHRRRLWEAKPGITGLWQVHGRSRTTFDEMVRLDLRYSKNWSLISDVKILLQTPRAVFSGDGAF